jgi:nucleotide-binding universal stress UspA family protein
MNEPTSPGPTILVPLDGSALSEKALDPAAAIAQRMGGTVLLLAVPMIYGMDAAWYPATPYSGAELIPVQELKEQARTETSAYLDGWVRRLTERGVAAQAITADLDPAEAIVRAAADRSAWLIAMATHGQGGLSRWAFGSVTSEVVHTATTPLLLIRAAATHVQAELHHILVALDGSEAAEAVLPRVQPLAAAFGAWVTLAQAVIEPAGLTWTTELEAAKSHYLQDQEAYMAGIAARMGEAGVEAHIEMLAGDDAAHTLLERLARGDVDLVALTTHGRTGLARWTLGSVSDRVVRSAEIPVLLERIGPPRG